MFSHPFSFHGRIGRLEYGLSYAISCIWLFLVEIIAMIFPNPNSATIVLILFTSMVYCWFLLAQSAKRCHDLGHSGWFQLIPFYALLMLFFGGDEHENAYGPDPKSREK